MMKMRRAVAVLLLLFFGRGVCVLPYAFSADTVACVEDRESEDKLSNATEAGDNGSYYAKLALIHYKMDRFPEAIAGLNKAIELGYESAEVYSVLGNAYFKNNMLKEAVAAYKQALEIDPALTGARDNLKAAAEALGK